MSNIDQCDMSGIHTLETIAKAYRERGGDVFLFRTRKPIIDFMRSTGFYSYLGADHFLEEDNAIAYLFYRVLDPAVCIYECDTRAFRECQNLPRPSLHIEIPFTPVLDIDISQISPKKLWDRIQMTTAPFILDVREPREFHRGHISSAESIPLFKLINHDQIFPDNRHIVLVCMTGRRSRRAAKILADQGYTNLAILEGGMLGWESAGLLEAVDQLD
jgi:SulP family sulfate permease